jgi:hypothetical protein
LAENSNHFKPEESHYIHDHDAHGCHEAETVQKQGGISTPERVRLIKSMILLLLLFDYEKD